MNDLPLPYINEVASQVIFVSTFLGGFAATIMGTFVASEKNSKLSNTLIILSAISACLLITTVFMMTDVVIKTTPGCPVKVLSADLDFQVKYGMLSFLFGITFLISVIAVSGWLKSKKMGIATTLTGIITLIFVGLILT